MNTAKMLHDLNVTAMMSSETGVLHRLAQIEGKYGFAAGSKAAGGGC